MKGMCPWTKVVVMLRNPVDRAFSQFQMCIDQTGTPEQLLARGESAYKNMSFDSIVETEILELQAAGITPSSSFDVFRDRFLSTRPMTHGGHSIVGRGLYHFQVEEWQRHWPAEQLKVLSIDEIRGSKARVQASLDEVFAFVGVPPIDISDLEPKNTRSYSSLSAETRTRLEEFYAPFNERLFALLGRRLTW